MLGRINHVAIAVPDLEAAVATYHDTLGTKVSEPMDLPREGVTTVFVDFAGETTHVELLQPLGESSPITKFLERNPGGGMHHVCYEVDDIIAARDHLNGEGLRVLGDGEPRIGAHGKPILFLHPKDFHGTLIELQQA